MTTQPEALRLADALDVGEISYTGMCKAAAELRRLHAVNAELLEALRALVENEGLDPFSYLDKGIGTATAAGQRWLNARAAIAKAEGKV